MNTIYNLTLSMFDGGAGAGAGAAGAAATGTAAPAGEGAAPDAAAPKTGKEEAKIVYGKAPDEPAPVQAAEPTEAQADPEAVDPDAEFDQLIAGKHKDQFSKKVQAIVDQRFKAQKAMEKTLSTISPALKVLGQKYGVDPTDADALAAAIQNDDAYYEDAAIQSGMTVEQYKAQQAKDQELERYRTAEAERQKQENAARVKASLDSQIPEVQKRYEGFDMMVELQNPKFRMALNAGEGNVMDAYEFAHKDELLTGTIKYAAQKAQKQVADDIRARGLRPAENGMGGQAAAVIRKADPNTWTRQDRDEVEKRIMRGETIR